MRCLLLVFIFSFLFDDLHSQSKKSDPKKAFAATLYFTDGSVQSGLWLSSSESTIMISVDSEAIEIHPERIYKIEIRKSNPRRSVRLGAGIGFTIGFVIGFIAFDSGDTDIAQVGHATGGGLIGAFTGAIIGQVIGMMPRSHYVLGTIEQYKRILPELQKYNR